MLRELIFPTFSYRNNLYSDLLLHLIPGLFNVFENEIYVFENIIYIYLSSFFPERFQVLSNQKY